MPLPADLSQYSHRTLSLLAERRARLQPREEPKPTKADRAASRRELADQIAGLFAAVRKERKDAAREKLEAEAQKRDAKVRSAMALLLLERSRAH